MLRCSWLLGGLPKWLIKAITIGSNGYAHFIRSSLSRGVRTMKEKTQIMKKLIVLVFLTISLSGCLVIRPDSPSYINAPQPPLNPELATVYTYYHSRPGGRINFTINDAPYFEAYWDTYSWVQLKPGSYTFKAQPGFWDLDLAASSKNSTANNAAEITINIDADHSYFLELSEIGEFTGTSVTMIDTTPVFEPEYTEYGKNLILVEPEQGKKNFKSWCVYSCIK
jgi:hypothetical protein